MPDYEQTPSETPWAPLSGPDGAGNPENETYRPNTNTKGLEVHQNLKTVRS